MYKMMLIGNLTRDPELREVNLKNGETAKVCTLQVAANNGYGENQQTMYVRVTVWRGVAEVCARYLSKGKKIYAEGPVAVNTYQGNDGNTHASLEMNATSVEFLSASDNNQNAAAQQPAARAAQPARAAAPTQTQPAPNENQGFQQVETDELPF